MQKRPSLNFKINSSTTVFIIMQLFYFKLFLLAKARDFLLIFIKILSYFKRKSQ